MDGRIELFRNGDWSIATNGVAEYHERVLPFDHDGYGQDAEWVAANFTNAEEILSVGYSNLVDAQVGTGLTNGLYKFTVTFTNTPPEAVKLTVGDSETEVTVTDMPDWDRATITVTALVGLRTFTSVLHLTCSPHASLTNKRRTSK